ncbi:MAG: hypothetical protein LBD28_05070 [Tannerellaceae bacterium]|jgi:hypothetical protein|nr:hypothetical protein [Tannerellaceae bacterium]
MKHNYHSPSNKPEPNGKKNMKNATLAPCQQTLKLLMQFARVYHVEPNLKKPLCGFILN